MRYKNLVKEMYVLAKQLNTSYLDLADITPTERKLLLSFLNEERLKREEQMASHAK